MVGIEKAQNSTTESEYLSVYLLGIVFPVTTSGAMYLALPRIPEVTPSGATLSLSQIKTSPVSGCMKKFPSFKS